MKGLDPAQKDRLKGIINEHLRSSNVYGKVRSFVRDFLATEEGVALEEDKLLTYLHEKKVVEDLIASMGREHERPLTGAQSGRKAHASSFVPTRGEKWLHVKVGKAAGFTESLFDASSLHPVPAHKSSVVAHLCLQGQRERTKPVALTAEPDLDDGFLFRLQPADNQPLSSLAARLHIVVVKQTADDRVEIIGTQRVEWRRVLQTGYLSLTLELTGLGGDTSVPVGTLNLNLELLPKMVNTLTSEAELSAQVRGERERHADGDRRFFQTAKAWWKDFLQIRPEHANRMVKLYARTESDVNLPVCAFVSPLQSGRTLRSAGEAARFVALIEYQRLQTLGGTGGRSEVWSDLHSVLASRKGDVEEHALLLCSLLLGFRFEAYCAIGTTISGDAHMWVVTLQRPAADDFSEPQVTFWESLTGSRYRHDVGPDAPSALKYGRLGCLFNHESFYANVQPDDAVQAAHFDLNNWAHWKAMDDAAIASVRHLELPPLQYFALATHSMEEALEASLGSLIAAHRSDKGLSTHWDPQLSYLLSPALLAYESENVSGVSAGSADFQQSIRNAVPPGYSFKGFPMQFCHLSAPRMLSDLLATSIAQDIIEIQGGVDSVRFALRVSVTAYPERVSAVWVMLAVVFAKLQDD
eukprot:Tamp_06344.p1 GENE.Tamp_06344~~Tamp_06344.p1  ORF type:complete len:666 (-),score=132.13 Tamp_06344:739-2655(-)